MKKIIKKCLVDGCETRYYSKGFCHRHYDQNRRYGMTYPIIPKETYCSFEGCKKVRVAKGLCNSHWAQMSRRGELKPIITHQTIDERFDSKYVIDVNTGCWVWQLHGTGKSAVKEKDGGYGRFTYDSKNVTAHRYAYERFHGIKITSEDTLDHLCRNTLCVNPEHLEKVTRGENTERKHLYYALQSENLRFRKFIVSIGYDPEKILGDIEE
jgi:hypothetical protein